jgi:DNA-binding transcriptional regulator YbjK
MPGGRREQALDAAIEVLGTAGVRGLTHRAVDAAAGIPAGSTSNYFRSRDALIDGVVGRLEELDRADWEAMAGQLRPADLGELAAALVRTVMVATGPARVRTTARYALFLEAATRPEIRAPLARSHQAIAEWGGEWMRRLGSADPEARSRLLLDYLDGVILHQIAFPERDLDPAQGIWAVLGADLRG